MTSIDTQHMFYYSAKNSTLIEPHQVDEYSFPSFVFDTSNDTEGYLKFNALKNFQYIAEISPIMAFTFDKNLDFAEIINFNDFESNGGFYEVGIFVGNLTKVEFVFPHPIIIDPADIPKYVHQECLSKATVGHPVISAESQNTHEV